MSDRSWSTAERVARESRGRLVAVLAKKIGDIHAAEDALAEAFAKALTVWPEKGVPDHPEAWLLTVAQRGFIDGRRAANIAEANEEHLKQLLEEQGERSVGSSGQGHDADTASPVHPSEDSRIALLFVCAHPSIDEHIRAPLMLQTVLGVNADAMAPLWVSKATTMSHRLVRAKNKISANAIPFVVPAPHERAERLGAVIDAVYAALTIGGEGLQLALEAEYLAALLASAFPDEPEVLGLFALCLFRLAIGNDESVGPIAERDVSVWDNTRITRAEVVLKRAAQRRAPGRFQLEAAIQSAHIIGCLEQRPVHREVVALYRRLIHFAPTLGAHCGLSAALVETGDLNAAKDILEALGERAETYQPYWVVRAKLAEVSDNRTLVLSSLTRARTLTSDPHSLAFIDRWIERAAAG
ncbi:MAG: DUF6596 domain-containing protein [Pseudomonadota bacterium]